MRILCVSAQKPDSTGSGVYLAETACAFVSAGHEVMVVAGLDVRDTPDLPEGARLEAVRFNTSDLPFPVVGMSDAMPYEATRYRDMTPAMLERFYAAFEGVLVRAYADFLPDLVICHHLYLVTALAVRLAPPCPVTAVCHSTDMRQMLSHGLEREAVTAGVRQLDRIFALHDEQKAEIVEFYGVDANRIVVVGTGYNAQVFCPRDVQNRHQGPLRIAYAGKICRKKGLESLIAALDLLPFSPDELEAVLVGGNGSREEVARIAERAARSRYQVSLPGRVSQDDLAVLRGAAARARRGTRLRLPGRHDRSAGGSPLAFRRAARFSCRVRGAAAHGGRRRADRGGSAGVRARPRRSARTLPGRRTRRGARDDGCPRSVVGGPCRSHARSLRGLASRRVARSPDGRAFAVCGV